MKNVTITLEDDVAKWARVWAAKNDKSLSRMLGDELKEKMLREENYQRAMEQFFSKTPRPLKGPGESYPTRESLYDRDSVR